MTLLQALGPGSHVIVPDDAYFGTIKLARDVFGPWGLELSIVDMTDLERVARAMRRNTQARLGRDAVQSPAPRRRHRGASRRSRTRRRALRRRQHVGHAGAPASARAGRRRRDARDDEIPRRTQRRARRRARVPRDRRPLSADRRDPDDRRRGAVAVRVLAHACAAFARCRCASARRARARARSRRSSRTIPCVEAVHYPGTDVAPGARRRATTDVRVRRNAVRAGGERSRRSRSPIAGRLRSSRRRRASAERRA